MRFIVALGLLALTLAACTKPNSDACCTTSDQCLMFGFTNITPCDADRVCNTAGNCVAPQCHVDPDCNDASMKCSMGECVPNDAPSEYTLTVKVGGSGAGAITSTPAGIQCSSGTCSGTFAAGTEVQLQQTTSAGSFLGWAYGCRGVADCGLTMNADQRIGALFGVAGEQLWTKQVSADGNDWAHDVAPTSDGDLIVTGTFAGMLTMGSTTLTSGDETVPYTFVAKLDGWSGDVIWAKGFPVDIAIHAAVDDAGAIYVTGNFTGTSDLGGGHVLNSLGSTDVFVVKLTSGGDLVWAYSVGGSDADQVQSLAVGNGMVFVVGYDRGITIGTTVYPLVGVQDGFVIALDAQGGTLNWGKALVSSTSVVATATRIDSAKVLVTGAFGSSVDFGSGSVTATGNSDAFVAEYTSTGGLASIDHYGEVSAGVIAYNAEKDVAGNVIVAGTFNGTFGPYTATNATQAFIAKYSNGTQTWIQSFFTAQQGISQPSSLAFSESGDVLVSGIFCNTVTIYPMSYSGPFCSVQNPLRNTFVTRLRNSTGLPLATTVFAPDVWLGGTAKAATDGRVYASGRFSGSANFSTGILTADSIGGKYDGFVTVFAP